jgi:hypothetical protein
MYYGYHFTILSDGHKVYHWFTDKAVRNQHWESHERSITDHELPGGASRATLCTRTTRPSYVIGE